MNSKSRGDKTAIGILVITQLVGEHELDQLVRRREERIACIICSLEKEDGGISLVFRRSELRKLAAFALVVLEPDLTFDVGKLQRLKYSIVHACRRCVLEFRQCHDVIIRTYLAFKKTGAGRVKFLLSFCGHLVVARFYLLHSDHRVANRHRGMQTDDDRDRD